MTKVEYFPAWRNAVTILFKDKYGYGDVIPHEELQAALELPKPTGRVKVEEYESWRLALLSQVDAMSTHLLENRNMCLKSIPGQGYMVLHPSEQTEYAMKHGMNKIKSEMRKMAARLSYIDRSALSHEDARKNADALARLSFLEQSAKRAKRKRFVTQQMEKLG